MQHMTFLLAITLKPLHMRLPTDFCCALQDYASGSLDQNMGKRAVQLRELLTKLGPSFVKVGQALSSRPDLLPKEYLEVTFCPGHSCTWLCPALCLLCCALFCALCSALQV